MFQAIINSEVTAACHILQISTDISNNLSKWRRFNKFAFKTRKYCR